MLDYHDPTKTIARSAVHREGGEGGAIEICDPLECDSSSDA